MPHLLSHVNTLPEEQFVSIVGPVFEHSPWVAEAVVGQRPFASVDDLRAAMSAAVRAAGVVRQLALIKAHPDLVGRVVLTAESQGEQQAAGLTDLSPEEGAQFDRYNRAYQARFGFPFVICARLNKKDAILGAFPVRLNNTVGAEREAALAEIDKIAALRLADLISE